MALLKEASEMFEETGCVPDADGEPVQAETMVPDAKEYISETIPESDLRRGDMGYAWICPCCFVARAKVATKVSNTRTSEK
jgi:hypothetical protein